MSRSQVCDVVEQNRPSLAKHSAITSAAVVRLAPPPVLGSQGSPRCAWTGVGAAAVQTLSAGTEDGSQNADPTSKPAHS